MDLSLVFLLLYYLMFNFVTCTIIMSEDWCNPCNLFFSSYPLTEVEKINAVTAEHHALAASKRAEEEMAALSQHRETQLNHHDLRWVHMLNLTITLKSKKKKKQHMCA